MDVPIAEIIQDAHILKCVGDEMDAPDPASMRQTDVEPFSYTGASTMKIRKLFRTPTF
jgi:hypothetical protein